MATTAATLLIAAGVALAYPPATIEVTRDSATISGLDCGTQYRIQERNAANTDWVDETTFSTDACPPPPPPVDLALNKPASASSSDNTGPAGAVNDGSSTTRWSSNYTNNQWWQVDLGSVQTVARVELNWEVAYPSTYRVQVSTDGTNFTTVAEPTISSPGQKVHSFTPANARYVRILGVTRATQWGISLWDAEVYAVPTEPPADSTPTPTPTPSPTPTPTPAPGGLPAGVTLRAVDGGAGYYGRFSNSLPTSADYFPIGVWGAYDFTAANVAKDKAVGLNLYVWGDDTTASGQANIAAAGMKTLQDVGAGQTNIGAQTAGWMLGDEYDMRMTPSQGLAAMQNRENQARAFGDNRALYTNYGKGVLFGWANGSRLTNAQRESYVNDFQDLVSSDFYWFTDPWQTNTSLSSDDTWIPERAAGATSISGAQVRRASNYGYQIDKMRSLDAADGQRKPIWAFVEVGSPFTPGEGDGVTRQITPPQIRAAVWHSIIAGARGVIYFQHSFSGSCMTHHVLRGDTTCYADTISEVTRTDGQIKSLAPVLNSEFADGYASVPTGGRVMSKRTSTGEFYVFAGSTAPNGQQLPISVRSGTSAEVVGENRTVPITNGVISDWFADGNAVHIYRIG